MALQIRRGLEAARTSITPVEGEILYVTDTKRVYIGDGTTVGGNQVGGNLLFPTIDNIKLGYATTATAGGTTTLVATSARQQLFTGSANQTIVLPVTSTLALGVGYDIENASTGTLTVQSSGTNAIGTIPPGVTAHLMCISTSLTTAAAWDMDYEAFATLTGTGNNVLATSPTISGLTLTGTLTAGGGVGTSGQFLQSTGTGVQWATAGGSVTAGDGISVSGSTVSLASGVINAGQYGGANTTVTITVDTYGRVTSLANNYISGGGGGNSFSTIYAGATGPVLSPSSTGATMLSASSSSDTLYLIAGSNVTITAGNNSGKAIMISATGGSSSGGGITWLTTTSSYNQGPTTITYPTGVQTSGNRLFVAFFGSSVSSNWINNGMPPSDPYLSWTSGSSMGWYTWSASTSSSAPSSQVWNFYNMGHMIYTTWVVTGSSMMPMSGGSSTPGSSFSNYISSSYSKTDTVLLGSTNSSLNMTTVSITAPSGYTSAGSKVHPSDSNLSVIAYQNPTPTVNMSVSFSVVNPGYTYYYSYNNASSS